MCFYCSCFFSFLFIPVLPPFGIFMCLSFAPRMVLTPWELPPGAFSGTLFVFSHFISFLYCFGYLSFLCLGNWPWKFQKDFFLEPFSYFFVLVSFWLCFFPLPSKLTLEIVKRSFFSNPFGSFFFALAIFRPLPSKIVKRSFFLNTFVFFSFWLCFLLWLQNSPWKLSKGAFSRTLFVFFVVFFRFGYISSFAFKIDLRN